MPEHVREGGEQLAVLAPEQRPWLQVFPLVVQTESFLHQSGKKVSKSSRLGLKPAHTRFRENAPPSAPWLTPALTSYRFYPSPSDFSPIHFARQPRGASRAQISIK